MAETKALAFVNRVLKTNYTNLHTDLKTGVALCELMNEVSYALKGTRPITAIAKMNIAFQHYENISKALNVMRALGVQDRDIFSTINLYDADNLPQVAHCLTIVQKLYDAHVGGVAPPPAAAAAPQRAAPAAPSAPARSAPAPPPKATAPVAPATPVSVPAPAKPAVPVPAPSTPATPRSSQDDKKISDALSQLDVQRARWETERKQFEQRLAAQEAELAQAKQREQEKQQLLESKEQVEQQLQEQYGRKLKEMENDMTNKVAQKLLEVEKERQARNNEIQGQQLQASQQIEQLTLKLQEMEKNKEKTQSTDDEIAKIKAQLTKEKEEALLQVALQKDRERMDAENRAISTMREQSEKAIQQLKAQAQSDLDTELQRVQAQYEEELAARVHQPSQPISRNRSASLAQSVEDEIAQRQKEIEAKLTAQFEAELQQVKQGIELRLKSEEAAFKQKEEQLNKELQATSDRLQKDKAQYEAQLTALQADQVDDQTFRDQIAQLNAQLAQKEQELRVNTALQQERDLFAKQQSEISNAKSSAEVQYKADLDKMQLRLTEETTKLQQLQQALAASNSKNAEADGEVAKIKSDMNAELARLQNEMKSNESKLKAEQDEHKKSNESMQNALEKLQAELEAERKRSQGLSQQFTDSQNKVKQLETAVTPAAAAATSSAVPSEREQLLVAELESVKKENAKLQEEIAVLKKQLTEAKSASASASVSAVPAAAPMNRPVNPMAAALRAAVPETPPTVDSDTPVTSRPPNPLAAAFKAGGGEQLAGGDTPARPPNPMAGGLLAGIQGGGLKLKKVTPNDPKNAPPASAGGKPGGPAAKPAGPISLVDQLKGGVQLKKAEPRAAPTAIADNQSTASIAAQLARERAARQAAGTVKFPK